MVLCRRKNLLSSSALVLVSWAVAVPLCAQDAAAVAAGESSASSPATEAVIETPPPAAEATETQDPARPQAAEEPAAERAETPLQQDPGSGASAELPPGALEEDIIPTAPPPLFSPNHMMALNSVGTDPTDEVPGLRVFSSERFDAGNVGWVLAGAAACLLLMAPGMMLFYCGLLRPRELPQFATTYLLIIAVMSIVWVTWGYTLSFARHTQSRDIQRDEIEAPDRTDVSGSDFIGSLDHVTLMGLESQMGTERPLYPQRRMIDPIPHLLFVMAQLAFCIVIPIPLIVALTTFLRPGGIVLFVILWMTIVLAPVTYWIWGGGWHTGAIDTAGGITMHVVVAFTALAAMVALTSRDEGARQAPRTSYMVLGAGLFWGGAMIWSGTRSLAADGFGVNAFTTTHLAACTGLVGWAGLARLRRGQADGFAICAGPLAGLAAIASGSGYVSPPSALVIGLLGGVVGYATYASLERRRTFKPFWNIFALQGMPAVCGALLTAVFAMSSVGGFTPDGSPADGLLGGNPRLLLPQVLAISSAAVWTILGSVVSLVLVRFAGGEYPASHTASAAESPAVDRAEAAPEPVVS